MSSLLFRRKANQTSIENSTKKRGLSVASTLCVRSFQPEDSDAVKAICKAHFRSLCPAAVQYYCLQHFRDIIALLLIGKAFLPWRELGFSILLYLIYLFARARMELEMHIFRDCPDLADIQKYYMQQSDSASHFWVAEYKSGVVNNEGHESAQDSKIVGCVGCHPTRDDPAVAQLLRLVVKEDVRRMRFGSRLLAQFENFAVDHGYREVRLYTNNLNTSHMKFIRQHGYEAIHIVPRSLMRGSLIQWKKQLPSAQRKDNNMTTNSERENNDSHHLSSRESVSMRRHNSLVPVMD